MLSQAPHGSRIKRCQLGATKPWVVIVVDIRVLVGDAACFFLSIEDDPDARSVCMRGQRTQLEGHRRVELRVDAQVESGDLRKDEKPLRVVRWTTRKLGQPLVG